MRTQDVEAADDKIGAELALVAVEKAGGRGDVGWDSRLPAWVQPLELQVGGHEEVDELGICGCSGTAGVDVRRDVVDLFTVFLDYNGAASGSGVSSEDDSSVVLDSDDGGSCFFIGERFDHIFLLEECVSR